jgi:hypothetical protein
MACRIRRARSTSSAPGVKTSFASSICDGWIAHLPSHPSAAARRAADRYPSASLRSPNGPSIGRSPSERHAATMRLIPKCHWSPQCSPREPSSSGSVSTEYWGFAPPMLVVRAWTLAA